MKYQAKWWLKNGHIQSIYPSVFRSVDDSFFTSERINTPDNDFLDLDWSKNNKRRLIILTHGLEGHSRRPYMLGMAKVAIEHDWDVLAWNFRSCSGEPNRLISSYHSGSTKDLRTVIQYALDKKEYQEIALIGFSIGGNKTLLHLGRDKINVAKEIIGAVTFSVPCDLSSSATQLAKFKNKLYMNNFLKSFKQKLQKKKVLFPDEIDLSKFSLIKNFYDYDSCYTAPMNGFSCAEEYWRYSSSANVIQDIQTPTLMISAQDDPFLTPECFPSQKVMNNKFVELEVPVNGGHVGFMQINQEKRYWSEQRAMRFFSALSKV